tara:strand:+ start:1666 stop:1812 length:147 start_codon:yes stop_codon:yes gene_type:complete
MVNTLKEDGDKLGKAMKNVNRAIVVLELVGLSILVWIFSSFFLNCSGL